MQSNGGLIGYAWAFRHPECVDRIFGICPVTDFRTWPTLPTVLTAPAPGLGYDLSLEELTRRTTEFNPVDNVAPLAKAGVKILHIHGDKDSLVPFDANSAVFVKRYKALGGNAVLVTLPGLGHGGKEFTKAIAGSISYAGIKVAQAWHGNVRHLAGFTRRRPKSLVVRTNRSGRQFRDDSGAVAMAWDIHADAAE